MTTQLKSSKSTVDAVKVLQLFGDEVILLEECFGMWCALNSSRSPSAEIVYKHIPKFAHTARRMAADQVLIVIARLLEKGEKTFSLDYVLQVCKCNNSDIQEKVNNAVERFREFAENAIPHRHSRVAHLSRKLVLKDDGWSKLPTGSPDDLDNAVKALIEIHCLLVENAGRATSYTWRHEDDSGCLVSELDGGTGVLVSQISRLNDFVELSIRDHNFTDEQIVRAIRTGNIQQVLDSIDTDQKKADL